MNRVSDGQRRWALAAAGALAVLAVAFVLSAWFSAAGDDTVTAVPDTAGSRQWGLALFGLALLALGGALAAALLGALLMRRRMGEALREARGERRVLAGLLDEWQWRSDAGHRLVRLSPPHNAPATRWSTAPAGGQCLWDRFRPIDGDEAALRARLDAQAPLQDLLVEQPQGAVGRRRWRLRAGPLFDGDGRFIGYLGTAQPVDDAPAQALATPGADASTPMHAEGDDPTPVSAPPALAPAWLPAVAQVLDQLPAAAFAGLGHGADWRLSYVNTAAQALLDLDGDPPPLDWEALVAHLPEAARAGARALLAQAVPGEPRSLELAEWALGLQTVPAGPREPAVQWLTFSARVAAPAPAQAPTPLHTTAAAPLPAPSASAADAVVAVVATADTAVSDQEAFSYTVSHDLRAPIRVVEGFTRIVKEDYGRVLDRIGIDHLDRVLGAAARMNNMIDALLDLSRLSSQPLSRQPVNLTQLATYVVDELRRSAPERQVEVHIQAGMTATGDPTMLRVALENLLGNAWKYSARTARAQISFEVAGPVERPVFCVRDNGAGFDMRFADRLFGIFQRLHSASDFAGTGIGLASVRRIVRRHGGEIWAEGEVGHGASFHFTLRG